MQCQDNNAKKTKKFWSCVSLRIPKLYLWVFLILFPERFYAALIPQMQRKILTPWIIFGRK